MIGTARIAAFVALVFIGAGKAPAAITLSSSDVGKLFRVEFDGNVNGEDVPGLTSAAEFTLDVFASNMVHFNVSLTDTSKLGIISRISAIGFNVTDGVLLSANVTGLFSNPGYVLDGAFPNQFGSLDICFTAGNTCQGGGNGGVYTSQAGTFGAALYFKDNVESITLDNFGVRYQSIIGAVTGNSGTGRGYVNGSPVPEPSTVAFAATGVAMIAAGLWRRRRRQE